MSLLLFSGETPVIDFEFDGSGGIVFGGTAPFSLTVREKGNKRNNYVFTGSGGIVFGGTGTLSFSASIEATGGIVFGGAADVQNELPPPTIVFEMVADGGLIFGGTAEREIDVDITAAGGIVFGGSLELHFNTVDLVVTVLGYQQARFFVRSAWWPHEVIAELTTAQGNYAWQEMEPGAAQVSVDVNDPALTEDVLQAGNFFSIEHPLFPPFAGILITAEDDGVRLTLNVLEHYGLLDGRSTPQDLHFQKAVGAGILLKSVFGILNSRSHTGIDLIAAPGPSVEDLAVGGQSGLELLNELHDRTDYEHWTETDCTRDHLITTLYFDQKRGEDVSDQLHLYDGGHFSDSRHRQDASQSRQTVTVLGGLGVELTERQSVTRSSLLNGGARDIAAKAYEVSSFLSSQIETPPGLYTERLQFEVMTSSRAELSRRGDKAQSKPLRQQQTFQDDVALPALSTEQTRMLRVGNVWTRHGRFAGRYLARTVRITGMELDLARGLCHLDSEIVL